MVRAGLLLLVFLASATAGGKSKSKSGPKPCPVWAKSWSDAVTEGQVCNLPIVVHRHGFY